MWAGSEGEEEAKGLCVSFFFKEKDILGKSDQTLKEINTCLLNE